MDEAELATLDKRTACPDHWDMEATELHTKHAELLDLARIHAARGNTALANMYRREAKRLLAAR